jgi:hypothetical protein
MSDQATRTRMVLLVDMGVIVWRKARAGDLCTLANR